MTSRAKWLLLIFLWLLLATLDLFASTYYVATDGSDGASGAIGAPFLTLEKARNTAVSGDTVYVRGGTYLRTNALVLVSTNSGVTFRNYSNETAILVGGLQITNWATYSGSIVRADISTQGVSKAFSQIVFEGIRQRLARYPNWTGDGTTTNNFKFNASGGSSTMVYNSGDIHAPYAHDDELQVFTFIGAYYNDIIPVSSINTGSRTITFSRSAIGTIVQANRYFVQNALEELDQAGEWYLDRTNKYLYFWPSNTVTSSQVYVPLTTNLFTIGLGSSNITIQGFTMTCCEGSAILATSVTNCLIAKNIINYVGNWSYPAVDMYRGWSNRVIGNDIGWAGKSGLRISGGVMATLASCGHIVDNNWIHNFGVFDKGSEAGGIMLYDGSSPIVGMKVSRNDIAYGPRSAIFGGGQNLLVSSNKIHHVMLETDDGGAFYNSGDSWDAGWGNLFYRNWFFNIPSYGFQYDIANYGVAEQGSGIYFDYSNWGNTVSSNIFETCSLAGVYVNGGDYNTIQNNIFANCQASAKTRNGAVGALLLWAFYANDSTYWIARTNNYEVQWASRDTNYWNFQNYNINPMSFTGSSTVTRSNIFKLNIAYNVSDPEYGTTLTYRGADPVYGTFNSNNYYYASGFYPSTTFYDGTDPILTFGDWQGEGFDANAVDSNPLLNADFSTTVSSPALALGFHSISTNGIGCYDDALRATWPLGGTNSGSGPVTPAAPRIAIVGSTIAGNVNSLR